MRRGRRFVTSRCLISSSARRHAAKIDGIHVARVMCGRSGLLVSSGAFWEAIASPNGSDPNITRPIGAISEASGSFVWERCHARHGNSAQMRRRYRFWLKGRCGLASLTLEWRSPVHYWTCCPLTNLMLSGICWRLWSNRCRVRWR
jgi:hypothetical protein